MTRTYLGPAASCTDTQLFVALASRAEVLNLAPPAMLAGDWFGVDAVVVPSVVLRRVSLEQFMVHKRLPAPPRRDVVVGGGVVGLIRYPQLDLEPVAYQGQTDAVFVLDSAGWWYESLNDAGNKVQEMTDLWHDVSCYQCKAWAATWTAPDKTTHLAAVSKCIDAISQGEIFQACIGSMYSAQFVGHPTDFFADGLDQTRPKKAAYMHPPSGAVASLSPELYLARKHGTVSTHPIKGTLPIDEDPRLLRNSEKDVAENIMIVDLVRNDLGKVATIGSVRPRKLLEIEAAPAVWHLVSSVQAEVPESVSNGELVKAIFPPPSVTGTPKIRAHQLIERWENFDRGMYCGALGMSSPYAGLDMSVAIRTVEFSPDSQFCQLGVGGGITADSDPEREWQECLAKASSIVRLQPSMTRLGRAS